MRVRELAEWLGATFEGDGEKELTGVAPLETAGGSELSFLSGRKAIERADDSAAGCLIVPPDYPSPSRRTVIRAPEPRTAFARAMNRFYPTVEIKPGIHPTAAIGKDVEIGALAAIGPHATIGDSSRIGLASGIGPGCSIGKRVVLGEGCVLHANVTIYDNVDIGRGVILHSGCVIGADGFGYVFENDRYHKFPQVGRVEIGDFVEIGANSCVDRAALGVTVIGEGTKLDNMVHVGHNCRIGRHVVVAAQTGFSGGVVVEDYAVIGGQVGIGDKARIEQSLATPHATRRSSPRRVRHPGCRGLYETSTAVTDQSFRSRSGTSCRNTILLPPCVCAEEGAACATRAPAPVSRILRLIIRHVNTELRSKSRVKRLRE